MKDDIIIQKYWFGLFILLYFLLQIPYLVAPPDGPMLFWREALTNMISKNIAFEDGSFMYPTVDHRDPENRTFAGEAPVYNYVVAMVMRVKGFSHNAGRYVSLLFFSLGLYAFYRFLILAKREHREAIIAVLVLAFSSWLTHSTSIFPDTFASCLILIAVYFGAKFLSENKTEKQPKDWLNLALFSLFVCFGGLSKMPMLMITGFLLPLWLSASWKDKSYIILAGTLGVIPVLTWFFYWMPHLADTGAGLLIFPTKISEGFQQVFYEYWDGTVDQFLYFPFNGYVYTIALAVGLLLMFLKGNRFWFWASFATLPILFVLVLKSGWTFSTHKYYVIPYVPLFAGIAASALRFAPNFLLLIILLLGAVESAEYKSKDNPWTAESYLEVEQTVKQLDPSGAPILSTFDWDPRFSYYANRNTIGLWPGQFNVPETQAKARKLKVKLLVLPKWPIYNDTVPFPLIYEDVHALYYRFE